MKYIWQTWLFRFKLVSDLDLYSKWKLNLHFKTLCSLEFRQVRGYCTGVFSEGTSLQTVYSLEFRQDSGDLEGFKD